jgi:2-keto-4-pentenoate hydratase
MSTSVYIEAMSVQISALRLRLANGMPRRGWKVGINVPEVQQKLGLPHALVGWLDGDRVLASGAQLASEPGSQPHVEPELCLRLSACVAADTDPAQVQASIDGVAPALEIVDYAKPRGSLAEIIGHCMFHHATVLGAFRPLPTDGSLAIASDVQLQVGALKAEPERTDLVPLSASALVLQVAARLGECGEALLPGDLILSGAFMARALPLALGAACSCARRAEKAFQQPARGDGNGRVWGQGVATAAGVAATAEARAAAAAVAAAATS